MSDEGPGSMSHLAPPGRTETVHSASVLVLAPHYDDEVLGCGGLLAQIAGGGGRVDVLFLTDGAADPGDDDPAAYSARRKREAEGAAEVLGLASIDHLDLPDGRLDQELDALAEAIRGALAKESYELLLVPSPLEITRDHQAAFAGLHRALTGLRPGDPLAESTASLRILAYEVNHPLHPDLLVDIGAQIPTLRAAMARYPSQQERHDYLGCRLGLARHRTLSLPPGVEAAEAYRRLTLEDFTTRSLSWLIRHLGGLPELLEVREGPRISVVVRTRDRPELLAEALESLGEGTYRRAEVVLVNDGGTPPELPADYPLPVVRVDFPENRGRSAAAQAGVEAAGGDYVAFLDDDDLAAPEHLATLAGLVAGSGIRVAYTDAAVAVYETDPEGGWAIAERRLPYSRDFDPDLLLVDNYIPFNTLLIERGLFDRVGPFDGSLPFFEDWDYLIRLAAETPFHHFGRVTCEYRHFRGGGHQIFGAQPRRRSDFLDVKARVLTKHRDRLDAERLARTVDGLRAEAVTLNEEAAGLRRERDDHRRKRGELEARHFANLGEIDSLKGEVRRHRDELEAASGEIARLQREEGLLRAEESRLRADIESQGEHLGRTYAEIERLNQLLRDMEATRAWRIHQWVQRRRPS